MQHILYARKGSKASLGVTTCIYTQEGQSSHYRCWTDDSTVIRLSVRIMAWLRKCSRQRCHELAVISRLPAIRASSSSVQKYTNTNTKIVLSRPCARTEARIAPRTTLDGRSADDSALSLISVDLVSGLAWTITCRRRATRSCGTQDFGSILAYCSFKVTYTSLVSRYTVQELYHASRGLQ
jgi:hypothetical protein